MERDPVCGMQVDPATARAKAEHGGRTYFFCCAGCAKKFEAAPQQYLEPRATPSGATSAVPTICTKFSTRPPHSQSQAEPLAGSSWNGTSPMLTVNSPAAGRVRGTVPVHPSAAAPSSPKAAVAVPDLRDGAGATGHLRERGGESGADEHDAALLGERRADHTDSPGCDGRIGR